VVGSELWTMFAAESFINLNAAKCEYMAIIVPTSEKLTFEDVVRIRAQLMCVVDLP
jgi:hypothetical protein